MFQFVFLILACITLVYAGTVANCQPAMDAIPLINEDSIRQGKKNHFY